MIWQHRPESFSLRDLTWEQIQAQVREGGLNVPIGSRKTIHLKGNLKCTAMQNHLPLNDYIDVMPDGCLISTFPSELRSVIRRARPIYEYTWNTSSKDFVFGSFNAYMWIPSEYELTGVSHVGNYPEYSHEEQYDWYKDKVRPDGDLDISYLGTFMDRLFQGRVGISSIWLRSGDRRPGISKPYFNLLRLDPDTEGGYKGHITYSSSYNQSLGLLPVFAVG